MRFNTVSGFNIDNFFFPTPYIKTIIFAFYSAWQRDNVNNLTTLKIYDTTNTYANYVERLLFAFIIVFKFYFTQFV